MADEPFDVGAMLAQAREQAARVEEVQRTIDAAQTVGQSAQGLVRVTIRGTNHITDVFIDPDAVRHYEPGALGGLVLEAVNDGMRRAVTGARDHFAGVLSDVSMFDDLIARYPQQAAATGWQQARTSGPDTTFSRPDPSRLDADLDGW